MDGILITAAVIVGVIAMIEIVTMFFRLPLACNGPSWVMVLPVFAEDSCFPQRLDRLAARSCGRTNVMIVDYSATEQQRELITQFARENPDAVIISHLELEKILSKTFAFEE